LRRARRTRGALRERSDDNLLLDHQDHRVAVTRSYLRLRVEGSSMFRQRVHDDRGEPCLVRGSDRPGQRLSARITFMITQRSMICAD